MFQPQSRPPIPVFILHWNRPSECAQTVQCFLKETLPLSITVIDNASDESNFRTLSDNLAPKVELVRLEKNRGWGGGLNVLLERWLKSDDGDYCLISAHDALPEQKCIDMLLKSMQDDPEIGIACPEYGTPDLPHFSPVRGVHFRAAEKQPPGTVESVDVPNGTLILFRKQCLREIGLFDERYFAYGDEHEIGLRARKHNWKVAIVWGAIVVNPGTWTPKPIMSYLFARNSLLLARNYGGRSSAAARALLMIFNTVRLLIKPPGRGYAFSASARMSAIRDFVIGRFGAPPSSCVGS